MARAMGGGRIADARALVLHALVLGAGLAMLFTLLAWTAFPALYRLLGGEGQALGNALVYSHVLFSGALLVWANFFLVGAAARRRRRGDARALHAFLVARPGAAVLRAGAGHRRLAGPRHGGTCGVLAHDLDGLRAPAGARFVAGQARLHSGAPRHPPGSSACSGTSSGLG